MSDLRAIVRELLSLVEQGAGSIEENERRLAILCDRLALASHSGRDRAEAGDSGEVPERDRERTRRLVAERFPRYGYYNAASPVTREVGSAEANVGDAIDDIADVADGLADVEWRFEHTGEADALWHFFDGFDRHWGEHLRRLQLYLHCTAREP